MVHMEKVLQEKYIIQNCTKFNTFGNYLLKQSMVVKVL